MMSRVQDRGYLVDRSTQLWVRTTGYRLELAEHPWLQGPIGHPRLIADEWLSREARRLGGEIREGGGLLGSLEVLACPGFDPKQLARSVRDFYQQTSDWRLDVWSHWCPAAWPFGWLLTAIFARRLSQLNLPLRTLDLAHGMDSRVQSILDCDGIHIGAAWFRTLRSTGQTVYSGWYDTATLPRSDQRSVRVVFPLPNGSVTVFLRPENGVGGALRLISPVGRFGDAGAYLIATSEDGRTAWVRRVPLAEQFDVYVDADGVLRTDHSLDLWHIPVIRLHYRMELHRRNEHDLAP